MKNIVTALLLLVVVSGCKNTIDGVDDYSIDELNGTWVVYNIATDDLVTDKKTVLSFDISKMEITYQYFETGYWRSKLLPFTLSKGKLVIPMENDIMSSQVFATINRLDDNNLEYTISYVDKNDANNNVQYKAIRGTKEALITPSIVGTWQQTSIDETNGSSETVYYIFKSNSQYVKYIRLGEAGTSIEVNDNSFYAVLGDLFVISDKVWDIKSLTDGILSMTNTGVSGTKSLVLKKISDSVVTQ